MRLAKRKYYKLPTKKSHMVNKPSPHRYYLDFFDQPVYTSLSLGFSTAFCLELLEKFAQRLSPITIYLLLFPLGIIFSTSIIITSWAFLNQRYWQLMAGISLVPILIIIMLDTLIT